MGRPINYLTVVLFLIGAAAACSREVAGQNLLLPSTPGVATGKGNCSDITVGVASDSWRVRKGDVFPVSAFHPFSDPDDLKYEWTVSNGKIVAGQGTSQIRVKAGAARIKGFLNASGKVEIHVVVSRGGGACSVEASNSIMVGRIREWNGFGKVDDLVIDKSELVLPCGSGEISPNISESLIVNIKTKASDPENDPLTYLYRVTGGTIVGTGADVKWDLSGVAPGSYVVHVGVDDGYGIHNTRSAQIVIRDCIQSIPAL